MKEISKRQKRLSAHTFENGGAKIRRKLKKTTADIGSVRRSRWPLWRKRQR